MTKKNDLNEYGQRQFEIFEMLSEIAYRKKCPLKIIKSHNSKSINLPIVAEDSSKKIMQIGHMADNFYSTIVGVDFKKPIPATFMYPISEVFRDIPISSHACEHPPLENFKEAYYKRKLIKRVGTEFYPYQIEEMPLMIGYLDKIADFNFSKILKYVNKNSRNNFFHIGKDVGFNIAEGDKKIITKDQKGFFDEIKINYNDEETGGCSVDVKLSEGKLLPLLLSPYGKVFVPTSKGLQKAGLRKFVPSISLESMIEDNKDKRIEEHRIGMVDPQTLTTPWGNKNYKISTDNSLDAILTAIYLKDVAAPTFDYIRKKGMSLNN